jgi:hypothetical protein
MKESFGNNPPGGVQYDKNQQNRSWCPHHWLDKSSGSGAAARELAALFGWMSETMARRYTITADRKWLAKQASEKIRNTRHPRFDIVARGKIENYNDK